MVQYILLSPEPEIVEVTFLAFKPEASISPEPFNELSKFSARPFKIISPEPLKLILKSVASKFKCKSPEPFNCAENDFDLMLLLLIISPDPASET